MEDYKIVEMICLGDESALDECQKKYGGELLLISQRITGSHKDAAECVNDALLQAWKTIPSVKPQNLRYYLIRIVRNISLDKLRRVNSKKRRGVTVAFDELSECLPDNCAYISASDEDSIAADINGWLLTLGRRAQGGVCTEVLSYGDGAGNLKRIRHKGKDPFRHAYTPAFIT